MDVREQPEQLPVPRLAFHRARHPNALATSIIIGPHIDRVGADGLGVQRMTGGSVTVKRDEGARK